MGAAGGDQAAPWPGSRTHTPISSGLGEASSRLPCSLFELDPSYGWAGSRSCWNGRKGKPDGSPWLLPAQMFPESLFLIPSP